MTFLLDVNVLIALIDPAHVGHDVAHAWFEREGRYDWATCPITQNGVIRIVGNPRYPNSPGSPADAAVIVRAMCTLDGHRFWSDSVDIFDTDQLDTSEIRISAQMTDSYLLALAAPVAAVSRPSIASCRCARCRMGAQRCSSSMARTTKRKGSMHG